MEKLFEKLIQETKWYKPPFLFSGFALITLLYIGSINSFLKEAFPTFNDRFIICICLNIIFLWGWEHFRNKLPENKQNKFGIIIAIESNTPEQKERIEKDFTQEISKLVSKNKLENLLSVVVGTESQIFLLKKLLNDFKNHKSKKYLKRLLRINKRVKGGLFIWGDIKERSNEESSYIFTIECMLMHPEVNEAFKKQISLDMSCAFPDEYSFFKKYEVQGFKYYSNTLYLGIRYIVGVAALLTNNINVAYILHKELDKEYRNILHKAPNAEYLIKRLPKLISFELFLMAKKEHEKGNAATTETLLNKALNIDNSSYHALILQSIILFNKKKPLSALSVLGKAEKNAINDYTWMYNKAFLLMYTDKYEQGIQLYKKLESTSFDNEKNIIEQCLSFNKSLFEHQPDKKQILFILGWFYYKKVYNELNAVEYFKRFLREATDRKYNYLVMHCENYLKSIVVSNKKQKFN